MYQDGEMINTIAVIHSNSPRFEDNKNILDSKELDTQLMETGE